MGQRSATETLFGIIAAFIEQRTWSQSELARRLETRTETVRKHLTELQASGFKIDRDDDHPNVYWSVPKNWFPGALAFKSDEVPDLLRLLHRAPKSELRDRLLAVVVARLSNVGAARGVANAGGASQLSLDPTIVRSIEVGAEEERWLSLIEDAVAKKTALKMRYFTASRRSESWRHASVHRIDIGSRPHFVATCHRSNTLRRFRVSSVSDARLDPNEPFRKVTAKALAAFDRESLGGFHRDATKPVVCTFVVREADAAWVAGNLPEGAIGREELDGGSVRFRIETTAVEILARFVVGLGAAARAETPALAEEVTKIARAALASTSS